MAKKWRVKLAKVLIPASIKYPDEGRPGPDPVGPEYFYHWRMLAKISVPEKSGYDMYSWKHTDVEAV